MIAADISSLPNSQFKFGSVVKNGSIFFQKFLVEGQFDLGGQGQGYQFLK